MRHEQPSGVESQHIQESSPPRTTPSSDEVEKLKGRIAELERAILLSRNENKSSSPLEEHAVQQGAGMSRRALGPPRLSL